MHDAQKALKRLLSAIHDYHENSVRYVGTDILKVLADPINRAQEALCSNVDPGNNAAMREALLAIDRNTDLLDIAESLASNLHPSHSFVACKIRKIVHDALSKPLRNCNRFDDELDAQLAFLNEEWLISVDRDSMIEKDKFENWTDEMRSAYARWLMVTAKGG